MGIPWAESLQAGSLLGIKSVLNEFIAFIELSKLPPEALSERTRLILVYALCGFANISSVAIQIGGISLLAPGRRADLVSLGWRAMVGGSLSTFMCAAVAGIVA
jgi:CNT family concentrative nucleoside transporter